MYALDTYHLNLLHQMNQPKTRGGQWGEEVSTEVADWNDGYTCGKDSR